MKSSFLSILLSVLAAISVAQNFELGINGGITHYSVHNFYSGAVYEDVNRYQTSANSVPVSASAMYNYKKFRFGVAVESNTISYKSTSVPDYGGLIDPPSYQYNVHQTPVKLVVNRVAQFKKLSGYVGLSGLYSFMKTQSKVIFPPGSGTETSVSHSGNGIGFAAQAGATYFITKHIGFNTELSGRYNNFPSGPLDKNIISVPVSVGFRYKL